MRRITSPVVVGALALSPVLLLADALSPLRAVAQEVEGGPGTAASEAAFLFAYRAKAGMREAFDKGYGRHLEWHDERDDPFVWYGWDVVSGADVGVFVDGTFGPTPADFDGRVAPGEDAADFAANVAPFAEPLWRRVYQLRSDLGNSRFLEERRPSPFLRALTYRVTPGASARFEGFLAVVAGSTHTATWATYRLLDGGDGPEYLVLLPARGAVALEGGGPMAWLAGLAGDAGDARDALSGVVAGASSALWVLRRDLTLIPGESQ